MLSICSAARAAYPGLAAVAGQALVHLLKCIDDLWRCRLTRQVDGLYARMGKRTSEECRMQHLRQLKIGDELSDGWSAGAGLRAEKGNDRQRKYSVDYSFLRRQF